MKTSLKYNMFMLVTEFRKFWSQFSFDQRDRMLISIRDVAVGSTTILAGRVIFKQKYKPLWLAVKNRIASLCTRTLP